MNVIWTNPVTLTVWSALYSLDMHGVLDGTDRQAVPLDLMPLIPRKFHSSEILQEYVRETGLQFGSFLTSIRDIPNLLNPNAVTDPAYLRHLGFLIGVVFPPEDETTVAEMKKVLAQAVDWYKVKGTYQAMLIIAHISGLTVNLYDMYTIGEYEEFIPVEWFVGGEGENPPDVPAGYYKSPHFGAEILLNKVYYPGTGGSGESGGSGGSGGVAYSYLWQSDYINNLALQVEEVRPVHTVPHFSILLNPQTDEFGHLIEVEGDICAKVTTDWEIEAKYFDEVGSGFAWDFDDGTIFDSSEDSFVRSIIRYKLGTGNYPCQLDESVVTIQNPVYTEDIDPDKDITILADRYRFEFTILKEDVLNNISELGLYIPGEPDDTLVLASCFPKITKDTQVSLKVIVEVFKTDLSV